jgi:hypothetical protein
MSTTRYFNKCVMALDAPYIGWVVRETNDKIVIFGEGDDRYDIPKEAIRFASRNVLIDLPFYEIVRKYKVSRHDPLPTDMTPIPYPKKWPPDVDLATYEDIRDRSSTKVSGHRMKSICRPCDQGNR